MEIPKTFLGYKREDGRTGTRNHVIILPVDDISNACAEAVANNIKGTIALPHSYGRLQFGADLELHFRTMIGTGKNPNVAAVIVIGIEPKWTKRIVDAIATTGKPVEGFSIEGVGDIDTIARVSKKAQEFSIWASEKQREERPISDLWISVKCGESDTTSGLASNPTVGLEANPEVVSDSPHFTEIHKSLIGHSSLCFSEAHITNSWAFFDAFITVPISPVRSIWKPSTGFPVFAIPSTILLVHLGSIPITITAATFGVLPVPIIVLKCNSKSAPNCNLP